MATSSPPPPPPHHTPVVIAIRFCQISLFIALLYREIIMGGYIYLWRTVSDSGVKGKKIDLRMYHYSKTLLSPDVEW